MGAIIKIDGKRYDHFTNLNVQLNYADIASTFNFSALFDPTQPDQRELFKPFSYKKCEIETDEGQRVLTGTILSHSFASDNKPKITTVSGYAKTGVIGDCTIAAANYPLEKTELTLTEITNELCDPFGINVVVSRDASAASEKFPKIVAEPTESVASFLIKLAAQKNLIISHDELGNLFIELISTFSRPVAFFEDGQPGTSISLRADGQQLHSEITVMKQASVNTDNAAEQTQQNPYVSDYRPLVKKQTSGTDNSTELAAKNSVLSELRNGLKVVITTDRWKWVNNSPELIIPNRLISVKSPGSYLFEETKLFVESVTLNSTPKAEKATIVCVLPEIFQGGAIKNIFQ